MGKTQQQTVKKEDNSIEAKMAQHKELERQLREQKSQLKNAEKQAEWMTKAIVRNKQIVKGSLRPSMAISTGKHGHGWVLTIKCQDCGADRTINKQDAHQVRFCETHRKAAQRANAKTRRDSKKVASADPKELKAQIAAAKAQLAKMQEGDRQKM